MAMKKIIMLSLFSYTTLVSAADITQINRYASVENKPLASQVNPLLTVQKIHFPQNITTAGDAINYWMQYSGFKLVHESAQSAALKAMLKQPLPQVQRNLGPLTIQNGLTVLAGQEVFYLTQDALHRTINFKLKPKYLPSKEVSHEKVH